MDPKILFCSINGVGLGHIARGINIANQLRRLIPCEILFATNSPFTAIFEKNKFPYVTGGLCPTALLNKEITFSEYNQANDSFFCSVVKKFSPQVVIFDLIIFPDTLLFAKNKGIFTVYVLREISSPEYFRTNKNLLKLFDLVLLVNAEDPAMTRELSNLGFDKTRVNYMGPVFRQPDKNLVELIKEKYGIKKSDFLITFSAGGGVGGGCVREVNDFYAFMERIANSLGSQGHKRIRWIHIKGPLTLFKPGKSKKVEVYNFEHHLPELFSASNLVVSAGGYNSVNEILAARVPAVICALPTNIDNQPRRSLLLQEKGLVAKLDTGDFPGSLKLFKKYIKPEYSRKIKSIYETYYHKNAARSTAGLIANNYFVSRRNLTGLAILRLNLDCRVGNFLLEEIDNLVGFNPYYFCGTIKNANLASARFYCEPFLSVRKNRSFYHIPSPGAIKKFEEAIFQQEVKVLYAEFLSDVVSFYPLLVRQNIPLITSFRGYELSDRTTSRNLNTIARVSRLIIARSKFQADLLISRGLPPEKIRLIYSGISLDKIPFKCREIRPKTMRFLSAGRFVEKKGFDTTIDFFKKFNRIYPGSRLTIIGEGELEEKLLAKIKEYGLTSSVEIKGFLAHADFIGQLYRHDVFILPCKTSKSGDREGIPNVLKEAMASGMICVSTNHSGIPELIEDGESGFLVNENDSAAILKKLDWIIKNSRKTKNISLNARFSVEKNFDVKNSSAQLAALIRQELAPPYIRTIVNILSGYAPLQFRVDLHVTSGCNGKCVMCYNWKNKVSASLTKAKVISLFSELKTFGVNHVRFHGQEPTLRKDLLSLMAAAKNMGFKVGLKTNALIFSTNKIIADYGNLIDELYLSVDSSSEYIHNLLRRNKESFKRNIGLAGAIKKYNPKTRIFFNTVVTRLNYKHLRGLMDLASSLGVQKVSFVLLNRKNRSDIDDIQLSPAQLKEFFFEILPDILERSDMYKIPVNVDPYFIGLLGLDLKQQVDQLRKQPAKFDTEIKAFIKGSYGEEFYKRFACFGVLDHLTIDWDGNVYPCCAMLRSKDTRIGNLLKDKFSSIWNSDKYVAYRKQVLKGNCKYKNECGRNFKETKEINNFFAGNFKQSDIRGDILSTFLSLFNFGEYLYRYQAQMLANYAYSKTGLFQNKIRNSNLLPCDNLSFKKLPIVTRDELREAFYSRESLPNYYGQESAVFRTSSCGRNAFLYARPKASTRFPRIAACFLNTGLWKIGDPWMKLTSLNCLETAFPVNTAAVERESVDGKAIVIPPHEDILQLPFEEIKRIHDLVSSSNSLLFHANPTYLKLLLHRFWRHGLSLKGVYAINSTYEILFPSTVKLIKKYLNCEIYDQYGCSEIGPISVTCKHGAGHIFSKSVYVEVIPDKELSRPNVGKVVVTDLENRVMPFVRYFTGDYAYMPQAEGCPCDFKTPMLGKILGRSEEIVFSAGRAYFPLDFDSIFADLENILLYQVIFEKERVIIRIVLEDARKKARPDIIESRIKALLGKIKEPVAVEIADNILPGSRGKYRSVIVER